MANRKVTLTELKKPIFPIRFRVLIKTLLALSLSLAMQQAAAWWQPATEFTSTPLYQGVPLRAEFRYTLLPDFSPGPAHRVIRLKGESLFVRFSTDEVASIARSLLAKTDDGQTARVNISGAGRAIYFANSRFFMVSVKPAVLVIVPHQFIPADFVYSVSNLQQLNADGRYGKIFDMQRERKLHTLLARWDDPAEYWINYLELGTVVPDTAGIKVVTELWDGPVDLETARADARWPFQTSPSARFSGYLEFASRSVGQTPNSELNHD